MFVSISYKITIILFGSIKILRFGVKKIVKEKFDAAKQNKQKKIGILILIT